MMVWIIDQDICVEKKFYFRFYNIYIKIYIYTNALLTKDVYNKTVIETFVNYFKKHINLNPNNQRNDFDI